MPSYNTDIKLGEKYRDNQTGIVGTATAISFYQFGCERVSLEVVKDGEIKDYGFDSPRLTSVATNLTATSTRTGGPSRGADLTRSMVGR